MIAVLVPVLGRPERAQDLFTNFASSSSGNSRLIFICSPHDTQQIAKCWEIPTQTLLVHWEPGAADYAKKINYGFTSTQEPWVLCGADDLVFHPGWDEIVLQLGESTGAGVVGTNDLHSPFTRSGKGSTHPVVRRTYVEEQGAVFDAPGLVYSEVYDHQWVDRELVEYAQHRGQFVFAKNAIVEHLHPHWGKGQMDATYDKGMLHVKADHQLYWARRKQWESR